MFSIENVYSSDHDSMAGQGGRIGFRYKTVFIIKMPAKQWNELKKRDLGGLVVDVANVIYSQYGFKSTYNPSIDSNGSKNAKNGIKTLTFEYFHNSEDDALKTGYDFEHGYMRHHQRAEKKYNATQWELDPNNQ